MRYEKGYCLQENSILLKRNLIVFALLSLIFGPVLKKDFKRAYKATDYEILDKVVESRGRSTAVTTILIDREKLIMANVGDSRAILSKNCEAKPITVDHEPQKEKELVESRGGFVSKAPSKQCIL